MLSSLSDTHMNSFIQVKVNTLLSESDYPIFYATKAIGKHKSKVDEDESVYIVDERVLKKYIFKSVYHKLISVCSSLSTRMVVKLLTP